MNRVLIGRVFLVLTIISVIVAMQQGGLWWASTAVCAAITLWGTANASNKPKD